MRAAALGCLVLAWVAACSHAEDLDRIRTEIESARAGASGTGTAGQAAGAGAGGDVSPGPACAPCPDLPEPPALADGAVEFSLCCTGNRDLVCGLRINDGARCFPRDAPGLEGVGCPDVTRLGRRLAGCCRPEGQCGVALGDFDLGCIARQDLPPLLGAPLEPVACEIPCGGDADCAPLGGGLICTEVEEAVRRCVRSCDRDGDCAQGEVCGLRNNLIDDRVDVYCQPPIGAQPVDQFCSAAAQCTHGVCARTSDNRQFCSRPCRTTTDCFESKPACIPSPIPNPSQSALQDIAICTQL